MKKKMKLSLGRFTANITVIILLTIALLSVGAYFIIKNNYEQMIRQNAEKDLNIVAREISSLNMEAYDLCMQLYNSGTFIDLLKQDVPMGEELAALNTLREYRNRWRYIHSISIYSPVNRKFYTHTDFANNSIMEYDEYFDIQLISMIRSGTKLAVRNPIPIVRVLAYPKRSGRDTDILYDKVLTFVYSGYSTIDPSKDRFVIINVSEKSVKQRLNFFPSIELSNPVELYSNHKTFVVDEHGSLISGDDQQLSDSQADPGPPFAVNADSASGIYQDNIDGTPSLVIYTSIDHTGWRLVRRIPLVNIEFDFMAINRHFLVILMIVFLSGAVASVFISRILYSPIGQISSRLFKLEIDNIKYVTTFEKQMLLDIFMGNFSFDDSTNRKLLEEFQLVNIEKKDIQLLIFSLAAEDPAICRSGNAEAQYKNLAPQIRSMLCGHGELAFDVAFPDGYVLVVYPELYQAGSAVDFNDMIAGIKDKTEYWPLINIAVSKVGHGLGDLSVLYAQAKEALKYCFYQGIGSICHYSDIDILNKDEPAIRTLEISLIRAINSGDKETAADVVNTIIGICRRHTIEHSFGAIGKLAYSLKNSIQYVKGTRDDIEFTTLDQLILNPGSFRDIIHLERALIQELTDICDKIVEQKLMRYKELLSSVVDYIKANYTSYSIGLNTIAQTFDLSPSYLEHLFVNHMGITIPDLIKKLRMEKACELIRSCNTSIDEISSQVGYSSVSNFYKAFKRITGLTPADYKKAQKACSDAVDL